MKNNSEIKYLSLLIGLISFHLINNYLWLRVDSVLLADDPFWHHMRSFYVYRLLRDGVFLSNPLKCLSSINVFSHQYGAFVQFVTAPFYFIFGVGQDIAVMVNASIFLPILLFSTYGIAKRLAGSKAGILSAFIISMYPIVFNHSRMYMLDLPVTALISLSTYLLIRCEFFKKKRYSLLLVLILFFGLLTKVNFILFFFTPLLIVLNSAMRYSQTKNRYFITAVLIFVFTIFYFIKGPKIFEWFFNIISLIRYMRWPVLLSNLYIYFLRLSDNGVSLFLMAVFIVSIFYFIKPDVKKRRLYLFFLMPPLLILLLFAAVNDPLDMVRRSMPFLVFTASITGIGLTGMKPFLLRRIFVSFVIIVSFIQFFAVSWGISYLPEEISVQKKYLSVFLFKQKLHFPPARNKFSHPARFFWDIGPLWDKIEKADEKDGELTDIVVFDPLCEIFYPLYYRATINEEPVTVTTVEMTSPNNTVYLRDFHLRDRVLNADYIIAANTPEDACLYPDYVDIEKKQAEDVFYLNIQNFELIEEFDLPNKVQVFLYKNLKQDNQYGTINTDY